MIRRKLDDHTLLIIPQPAHAWLAGQLALHWGNDRFVRPAPRAEVILAISQHDNGWAEWEQEPHLNPETGQPRSFKEVELNEHLGIWHRGVARMLLQNRYAALLLSLHSTSLYAPRLRDEATLPHERDRIRAYLGEQEALQKELRQALTEDERYAQALEEASLQANLCLLKACDALSLHLCGGATKPFTLTDVPERAADVRTTIRVTPGQDAWQLSPYPFDEEPLEVHVEARVLSQVQFEDEVDFHTALGISKVERLSWQLQAEV
ncbi:MAG TPA: DUF3891 family protein [Anaerolineae bacterium]|nr:DUF3891 family protein [Anaerolineae bacterium]HIQ06701.1 DUF3891 family protein [Anaerolineae bacterium]